MNKFGKQDGQIGERRRTSTGNAPETTGKFSRVNLLVCRVHTSPRVIDEGGELDGIRSMEVSRTGRTVIFTEPQVTLLVLGSAKRVSLATS